ncbi:MAG: ABC transporter substrate-binding protein [Betaproteobacteria bacterium]|nr:ABC transporter substrate-binding protein [Betaproteobacteria bacterium]
MNRRDTVFALLALSATPLASFAQQPQRKVSRIGLLISETVSGQASRIQALRAGLRERGYVEGENIAVELRSAGGDYDRLPALAAELAHLKVDVIVSFGIKATIAAKGATTTIPIVFPLTGDPVAQGVVDSFARPGGNLTGSSIFGPEVSAKRVELFKEAVPRISRVAVLANPSDSVRGVSLQAMRATGKALKLELHAFEVRRPKEFESTFAKIAKGHFDALMVSQDTLFAANANRIAQLAAAARLPSAGYTEYADAGGLIGFGTNDVAMHRRAAYFVDRILKGANPRDLPIEQATRFELVINLKTARALGVKIPQSVLIRADRVVE